MKTVLIVLITIGFCLALDEITLPTQPVPVLRESNSMNVKIQHRFKRAIGSEQTGTFTGGAGVNYRVDYQFLKRINAELGYTSNESEIALGLSYSHPFIKDILQGSAGVLFFSMDTEDDPARNFRYHVSLSSHLFNDRFISSLSVVYNGYYEKVTGMAGIRWTILDFLHIMGELGFTSHQVDLFKENSVLPYMAGLAFTTYAHQFDLYCANSTQTGAARSLMGGEDGNVYIGFRITRLFSFGTKGEL